MERKIVIRLILFCVCSQMFIASAFCASQIAEFICEQGINHYYQGQYNEALKEFKKVLMLESNNPTANKYIDTILERQRISGQEPRREASRQQVIRDALDIMEEKEPLRDDSEAKEDVQLCELGFTEYCHGARGQEEHYEAARFSVNSQVSSFTGAYDDPDKKTTTSTYFQETFKAIGDKGEISLSMPYVIRNGGGVTPGETSIDTRAIPKRADGIGDIWLKGEYYWLDETDVLPNVDLSAKVKFPLASHDRGLGTGRYDFGTGASLMKRFDQLVTLLDLGLLVRKRPNGSTIRPIRFDYSAGLGYPFTQKSSLYLFLDGSSKSSKSAKEPLELVLATTYRPRKNLSLNAYILFGLSESSPDIGASTGITRYF